MILWITLIKMSNINKLYECWKLLYSMPDEELDGEKADKIRDEADIYFYLLSEEELELFKEKVKKTVRLKGEKNEN